jgi:hypothetical protein
MYINIVFLPGGATGGVEGVGLLEEEVGTDDEKGRGMVSRWGVMVGKGLLPPRRDCDGKYAAGHPFMRSSILGVGRHMTVLWGSKMRRHHGVTITLIEAMNPMIRMGKMMLVLMRCGRSCWLLDPRSQPP